MHKTVGDEEHVKIVDLHLHGKSMVAIVKELDRSSVTVHSQIFCHNESIERRGYCQKCRRMKSTYDSQKDIRVVL